MYYGTGLNIHKEMQTTTDTGGCAGLDTEVKPQEKRVAINSCQLDAHS